MSKKSTVWMAVIAMALCLGAVRARAQESAASKAKATDDSAKILAAFRLDYALSEWDDGKKINTRRYSMNVVPGWTPSNEIKIGSRVPVEGKQGEMQYIDVGTNIWSRVTGNGDPFQLEVRADLTNFANAEQEGQRSMPLLRQLRIDASTLAMPGKPTVVGVVDDPNSKRQFQLEVTVTKLM
jgi:hypothetical protein